MQGRLNDGILSNYPLTEANRIEDAWKVKPRTYNDEEVAFKLRAKGHQNKKFEELKNTSVDDLPPVPSLKINKITELGVVIMKFN